MLKAIERFFVAIVLYTGMTSVLGLIVLVCKDKTKEISDKDFFYLWVFGLVVCIICTAIGLKL